MIEVSSVAILRVLARHEVRFLVVGGVNAVLLGAPIMTFDLDIVHDRAPENIELLLLALKELEAKYRLRPELTPGESHLSGPGHQLLNTKFGMLDVLGKIGTGRGYEELLPFARSIEIGAGAIVKILSAEALLEEKLAMRRTKDLTSIAWLQEIIRRQG